jgi:DNA adenine methylase
MSGVQDLNPQTSDMDGVAGPLFKWVGGKQLFLARHSDLLPTFEGNYFEPFAGGLSTYFHIYRREASDFGASLGDKNLHLVRTYNQVKEDWGSVADGVRQLEAAFRVAEDKSAFYYEQREIHNQRHPRSDAARFIFIMNTAWNGLFRTNLKGKFNVPIGLVREPLTLPSNERIRAVSESLRRATIQASTWQSTISTARAGDFIFFDPPYFSDTRMDRPAKYLGTSPFTAGDHHHLAAELERLQRIGVDFILMNSAESEVLELYHGHGLSVETIETRRTVSGKVSERAPVIELIVRPKNMAVTPARKNALLKMRTMSTKFEKEPKVQVERSAEENLKEQ